MRKIFLVFLVLFPLGLYAQTEILKDLCYDYDKETETILEENNDKQSLAVSLAKLTLKLRGKHKRLEVNLKKQFEANNPDYTEAQLEKEFVKQMTLSIITYSNNIIEVNRRLSGECPIETESLKLIRQDIDKLLTKNSNLSLIEQKKLADSSFLTIINRHKKQVEIDYKKGTYDFDLLNNLGNYLIHTSDSYCRAFIFDFTLKAFN